MHSSQDFWEEIEPKINTSAGVLDFSATLMDGEGPPDVGNFLKN